MAGAEDTNGRARLSLMDKERVLSLLQRSGKLPPAFGARLTALLQDTESLLSHSTSLFEKINFLVNVTLGRAGNEQNRVIRLLSFAALVFLPPTLVASVYGMNFEHIPELSWSMGYPFALTVILLAGVVPYVYFKRKGWR
jgi:magnesium transporter